MSIKQNIAVELHRQARRRFPTRKTELKGIHDLYQADLVEMIPLARDNKGFKYIMTLINCFTKVADAFPLKSKTGVEVAEVLKSFFKRHKMRHFQTDQGKEWYNTQVKKLLKQYNINHYSTFSDKKAAIVERFNRTLKNMMWRAFTSQGTHKWLTLLPQLITKYNNTFHHTIGMKPVDVNSGNEVQVMQRIRRQRPLLQMVKTKFKIGDQVRISKYKQVFAKGYLPNWTNEIFTVNKVKPTVPVTYTLKDSRGNVIQGGFYQHELLKSRFGDVFLVERVLRRKGNKMLVRWLGFDKSHDSWVNKSDII